VLDEPNVLIMDEPTNDMDTDMLAAIEDLLDSWPGTLVVVSHDRYLLERVTDQQFAVLPGSDGVGRLRHLPGGVDEYLRFAAASAGSASDAGRATVASVTSAGGASAIASSGSAGASAAAPPALKVGGAERRTAEKELASLERRIAKLQGEIDALHVRLAEHDTSDYTGIGQLHDDVRVREAQRDELETRWLELGELLG
jgi:hypothetical protein